MSLLGALLGAFDVEGLMNSGQGQAQQALSPAQYPAAYEAALQNFNSIPDRLPRLTPRGAKLLTIAAYEAALQNFNSIPDRLPRLTPRGAKLLAILVTARMRLVTEALPASELQSFCRPHHVLWTVR
jgi:hypothetical protein